MLQASFLLLAGIFLTSLSLAQQVIATDGNYAASSQGSLSWTLGEVVTETGSSINGYLTQGFQQNYDDILALENLPLEVGIAIFPNPFSSEISINIAGDHPDYEIFIHDAQYRLIFENALIFKNGSQQMNIDLSELSDGFYFLVIRSIHTEKRFVARMIKTNN